MLSRAQNPARILSRIVVVINQRLTRVCPEPFLSLSGCPGALGTLGTKAAGQIKTVVTQGLTTIFTTSAANLSRHLNNSIPLFVPTGALPLWGSPGGTKGTNRNAEDDMTDIPMSEEREQVELVAWFKRTYGPELAEALHHSPNGGKRHPATARRFKLLGVRRGFPDLVLYNSRGDLVGLAIEFKPTEPRREATSDQVKWLQRLESIGFETHVAHGIEAAKTIIENYLEGWD